MLVRASLLALTCLLETACRCQPAPSSSDEALPSAQRPAQGAPTSATTRAPLRVHLVGSPDAAGPVVVLLHGFGAPGDDLLPLAQSLAAPQGTRFVVVEGPLSVGEHGRAWWMLDLAARRAAIARGEERDLSRELPEGLVEARARVLELLARLQQELSVEPSQIVLVGFSQGGMLALDVVLHAEQTLGGVAVLSGTLLAEETWTARMPARNSVPVMISHGRSDGILPFRQSERLRDALRETGFDVAWVAFEGGHTIPRDVVVELEAFLRRVLGR